MRLVILIFTIVLIFYVMGRFLAPMLSGGGDLAYPKINQKLDSLQHKSEQYSNQLNQVNTNQKP